MIDTMESKFTPQLVMPESGDPYYNRKSTGGYNPCIFGNPQRRVSGLNVLPNCVGYSVGRYNALGNYGYCKYLGSTNACNFVDLAKRQGLKVTQKPTLGGVMVWNGGARGEGHVANVELILGDKVVTSESEYYGKPFTIYTRSGKNWSDGCYWMGASYAYLGCIKNPAVEDDMTKVETMELVKEMFPVLFAKEIEKYFDDLKKLPADEYAKDALKWAKDEGIMIGDKTGNQMPQSPVKREDLAVVLYAREKADE